MYIMNYKFYQCINHQSATQILYMESIVILYKNRKNKGNLIVTVTVTVLYICFFGENFLHLTRQNYISQAEQKTEFLFLYLLLNNRHIFFKQAKNLADINHGYWFHLK